MVTVRKLLSLFLSLIFFNKGTFGRTQWIGTAGVFGGSFMWTLMKLMKEKRRKKEHERGEKIILSYK